MLEAQAIIERVRGVSASVQRLDLSVDRAHAEVNAGEIFLARSVESLDPFLREPWIPVQKAQTTVTVEIPTGKTYWPGQVVSLLGPVGRPFPLRETSRRLLLIAVDAMPSALLLCAQAAIERKDAVVLVLVGAARQYPREALPAELEILSAESILTWEHGGPTLKWAQQTIAVAAPPFSTERYTDLLSLAQTTMIGIAEQFIYGLYQPPLPCGVGACSACLTRCGSHDIAVCTEGFALDLTVALKQPGGSR